MTDKKSKPGKPKHRERTPEEIEFKKLHGRAFRALEKKTKDFHARAAARKVRKVVAPVIVEKHKFTPEQREAYRAEMRTKTTNETLALRERLRTQPVPKVIKL